MKPQDRHAAIWSSPHLSGPERFLLLALCSFQDEADDWVSPTASQLARMTGSKRQTVSARLGALRDRGLLQERQGPRLAHGGRVVERRLVWPALRSS